MNLFEDTNPRALKELLGEIHNRTSVLPDFQRDPQDGDREADERQPAGSLGPVPDDGQCQGNPGITGGWFNDDAVRF